MTKTPGDLRDDSLTPQARAGKAVYLLMRDERGLTSQELTESLRYSSRFSLYDLIDNLALTVPLYFDEQAGRYKIAKTEKEDAGGG